MARPAGAGFVAVMLVFCLCGCGDQPDDPGRQLRDYRDRVLRLLEVAQSDLAVAPTPALPAVLRKRELLVAIDVETVGLLEFFELQQCDLGSLVARRSGSLGKLAPLSERLAYELSFLRVAQGCLSASEDLTPDARQLVSTIVERKQSVLDKHMWNAIFAGPEMLRRLGSADGNLSEFATQLTDLRDLSRNARSGRERDATWNEALQRLSSGGGIGASLARWQLLDRELALVTAALVEAGGEVCRNGRPTPRARNLKALLEEFFVVRVRAKLAPVLQRDETWVRAMNALADDFTSVAPAGFQHWREQTLSGAQSLWQRSQNRLSEHARAWSSLLETCGLPLAPAPGPSSPGSEQA